MSEPVGTEALDLGALKELCDKATPGSWVFSVTREDCGPGGDPNVPDEYWTLEISNDDESILYSTALEDPTSDAAFIAASRSAIPALIAEVERLSVLLDQRDKKITEAARVAREVLNEHIRPGAGFDTPGPLVSALIDIEDVLGASE
jgi:hypothetical protein